jgi:adenosylmethionine-8-amino-7-oxononanoate aminotransferase
MPPRPDTLSPTPPTPLQQRDLAVLWHPCAQMKDYATFPPLEIASAQGLTLTLRNGDRVLDAISSWWCKSLGHRHPRITAALKEQADRFEHVLLANTTSEAVVSLCERLIQLANRRPASAACSSIDASPHFTRVFFADNGSTGVEVALKMALQAQFQRGETQRTRLATLTNGYHGETAGAMSVSDLDLYNSPHGPMMFESLKLTGLPYRSGPTDPAWQDASAEWPVIEAQLDAAADTLAGLIVEPVAQCAGHMRFYSPDLLRRLRAWCTAHNVYLIADEIAAGMYRLGHPLASHHACLGCDCGTTTGCAALPDLVILSKGLTAGYVPMAAVLATESIYGLFYDDYATGRAFMHSNTYAGNALAVAVAHAALNVYADEGIAANVAAVGRDLADRFFALPKRSRVFANPRAVGMAAAIDLVGPDGCPLDPAARTGYRVYQAAVCNGALLRPLGDTMYLFPPLNTTIEEIDAMIDILLLSVAQAGIWEQESVGMATTSLPGFPA